MIKKIISGRNEEAIIFLQCFCGNEIISIYYYKATPTCPEIIHLDYFGSIDPKLNKYKYYSFDIHSFMDFLNALENCVNSDEYSCNIKKDDKILSIIKNDSSLIEIKLSFLKKKASTLLWGITIRDKELDEFISLLKKMGKKILEANKCKCKSKK